MNSLTDELRKLAEAWPKDSGWEASSPTWVQPRGYAFTLKMKQSDQWCGIGPETDEIINAAARTIIEDLLKDMGYIQLTYTHFGDVSLLASSSKETRSGGGATRTEALVKVANAILAVRSIEVSNG